MREWAAELVDWARTSGVELTGEDGLLTALVCQVLQTGLEVEMTDHLGYEPHAPEGRWTGNSRNGHYPKAVSAEIGEVELGVRRGLGGRVQHHPTEEFSRSRCSVPPRRAARIASTSPRPSRRANTMPGDGTAVVVPGRGHGPDDHHPEASHGDDHRRPGPAPIVAPQHRAHLQLSSRSVWDLAYMPVEGRQAHRGKPKVPSCPCRPL